MSAKKITAKELITVRANIRKAFKKQYGTTDTQSPKMFKLCEGPNGSGVFDDSRDFLVELNLIEHLLRLAK